MTNAERVRRHLSDTSTCQVCRGGEETIMHVLRDCPSIAGIWNKIVPTSRRRAFFEKSLFGWVYENLGIHEQVDGVTWSTMFAMCIWWSWKWRCGYVFGETGKCRDRVKFIREISAEVGKAVALNQRSQNTRERTERLIAWKKPQSGWTKLNTDGASHGNPGFATAGGVLRDEQGRWVRGFALNIGVCTAPMAELWGVYYGLLIAWECKVTRLEVEIDSKMVVEFLQKGIGDSHPLSFLVRLCYGFLSRDWIVRCVHVYREANRLADGLANYAFTLPLGLHLLSICPTTLDQIAIEDETGNAIPRLCHE